LLPNATKYLKMRVLVPEYRYPLSLNRFPFRVKMKIRNYGELICEDARPKARYINVCVPLESFPDLYCQSVLALGENIILSEDISYYYTRNALLFCSKSAGEGCDSIVYCAASPSRSLLQDRGKFIRNRRVENTIEQLLDTFPSEELWQFSMGQIRDCCDAGFIV
jgi:hypothetical protein